MNLITPTTTALAAVAVSTLFVAGASAQNLLVNPDFELNAQAGETDDVVGWDEFGANFVNQALANSPVNSLKQFGQASGVTQTFPVVPGDLVNGEAFAANPSFDAMLGDQVAAVNLEFLDINGAFADVNGDSVSDFNDILTTVIVNAASPADSTFQFGTVSGVAPADAVSVRFVLITGFFGDVNGDSAVTGGGAPYFDDASLTIGIPEPTSIALLGLGGLAALRRRSA